MTTSVEYGSHKQVSGIPGAIQSTVNEVVAKRMVKKQQMRWSPAGAHYLLQTRTAVLNGELRDHYKEWYPEMRVEDNHAEPRVPVPKAA